MDNFVTVRVESKEAICIDLAGKQLLRMPPELTYVLFTELSYALNQCGIPTTCGRSDLPNASA